MTTANKRGTFVKSLEISRDGSNRSNTMLKNTFLKKANNYVCQLTKFVTNLTPKLNLDEEVMFEILPRGPAMASRDNTTFPAHWKNRWRQFTPKPYFSVCDLALQLETFFKRFSYIVRRQGANNIVGDIDAAYLATTQFPFVKHNNVEGDDDGWGAIELTEELKYPTICKFVMNADGTFTISVTDEFVQNFYIRVGEQTQIKTGFPEFMYISNIDGVDVSFADFEVPTDGLFDNAGLFVASANVIDFEFEFHTEFSMTAFDERLSIDVQATFPISNSISVVDGVEEHEFILARFPLSDYKRFDTDLIGDDVQLSDFVQITEDVNVGLEDLARGNPNITSIYLLPGSIRQVTIELFTRYYVNGLVRRVATDMTQGFWSLKMIFSKKET